MKREREGEREREGGRVMGWGGRGGCYMPWLWLQIDGPLMESQVTESGNLDHCAVPAERESRRGREREREQGREGESQLLRWREGAGKQCWQLEASSPAAVATVRRTATAFATARARRPGSSDSNSPQFLHPWQMGQPLSDRVSFELSNHHNQLLLCPVEWDISKCNAQVLI